MWRYLPPYTKPRLFRAWVKPGDTGGLSCLVVCSEYGRTLGQTSRHLDTGRPHSRRCVPESPCRCQDGPCHPASRLRSRNVLSAVSVSMSRIPPASFHPITSHHIPSVFPILPCPSYSIPSRPVLSRPDDFGPIPSRTHIPELYYTSGTSIWLAL